MEDKLVIKMSEMKSLLDWAFYSGKNNVSDFYYEQGRDQTIVGLVRLQRGLE